MMVYDDDEMVCGYVRKILSCIDKALENKQFLVYDRLLDRFSDHIEFLSRKSLQDKLYVELLAIYRRHK